MDKVRLILTVISIVIVVVPIVGVVLMYQNNLLGLFIPPQLNNVLNSVRNPQSNNPTDNVSGLIPENSQVNSTYDPATRTFTLTFPLKNPIGLDVTVNSMSGDLVCDAHNFPLGKATLTKPVSMKAGETATMTVAGTWTEDAITHFKTAHAGEKTITVDLTNTELDASGFKAQINEKIQIPNVPLP
jgi:hypothetical protein